MCLEAIKKDASVIKYVNPEYQTIDMLKYVLEQNIDYIQYVDKSLIGKVDIKFLDGSSIVKSLGKLSKNTIKITSYTNENTLIETIKTTLSISQYIKSKHDDITVIDNVDILTKVDPSNISYWMKLSDEVYDVYKVEKVNVVKKGWIYNSEDVHSKPIKVATYELVSNNK